jgi:hypothetical protein
MDIVMGWDGVGWGGGFSKHFLVMSETTLNYRMMMKRYPNLKEEIGGLNLTTKSPLYLTENLLGGQLPPVLRRCHIGLLSHKVDK